MALDNLLLDSLFDGVDFSAVHALASLIGMAMVVALMQMSWHKMIAPTDPDIVTHLRRIGMLGLALTFWWSFSYSLDKGWQPWPPHLAMTLAIDLWLAVSVVSAVIRRKHMNDERNHQPTNQIRARQ